MATARRIRWFWLALGLVAADRVTKLAIEMWTPLTFRRTIIPGVVTLVHTRNPGIAFGLLADADSRWFPALLVAVSIAVICFFAWLLATGRAGGRRTQAGLALILGGAVGNLIDRLAHGGVTDFLEVRLGSFRWPAFNVADSAITIGAAMIVLDLLLSRERRESRKA